MYSEFQSSDECARIDKEQFYSSYVPPLEELRTPKPMTEKEREEFEEEFNEWFDKEFSAK